MIEKNLIFLNEDGDGNCYIIPSPIGKQHALLLNASMRTSSGPSRKMW